MLDFAEVISLQGATFIECVSRLLDSLLTVF